jgi:hypothetical protein
MFSIANDFDLNHGIQHPNVTAIHIFGDQYQNVKLKMMACQIRITIRVPCMLLLIYCV